MKSSSIAFGLSLACVFALASCGKKDNTSELEKVDELPRVTVDVVHQQDVPQTKVYTATVEAENINNISPSVPNRIKSIKVDVGDRVHKGQVLVDMDFANADQLKISLDQIEREYKRASELLKIGAGTQQSVDQLKAQFDAARSQYDNMLENTVLRSPINGIVTARNYDPGDMSGNLPILTVGQLSPVVKVMINVSENDMAMLRTGMPVSIVFDAFGDEQFTGTIKRIYPTVDTSTRTFQVEVQISNTKERIKPGMFARVTIDLGSKPNVVIPDRAIVKQTGSGNKYVFVLHGDKVSYNRVELGQRIGNSYELLSGVQDGDTVVITGQSRLIDGSEVEIQK